MHPLAAGLITASTLFGANYIFPNLVVEFFPSVEYHNRVFFASSFISGATLCAVVNYVNNMFDRYEVRNSHRTLYDSVTDMVRENRQHDYGHERIFDKKDNVIYVDFKN